MKCFLLMISFTQSDRSSICVIEENMRAAVEEFINVDPSDRWTVEDLISRFARKEAITEEDKTVGYLLISMPEKTVEMSASSESDGTIISDIKKIVEKQGYKFIA
ncbi:MAG: TA0956 family protein [Thermoplasmatales archaeon]